MGKHSGRQPRPSVAARKGRALVAHPPPLHQDRHTRSAENRPFVRMRTKIRPPRRDALLYNSALPFPEPVMEKLSGIACLSCLALVACGADVASTTATAAQLKAEEAKQAQAKLEQAQKALEAMQRLSQQRLEAADRDTADASP